jgi:hypothetical protein
MLHLSCHLCPCLVPAGFPTKIFYAALISPTRVTYSVHLIFLYSVTLITYGGSVQIMKFLIMQSSPASRHVLPLKFTYSPQYPVLKHLQNVSVETVAQLVKSPCLLCNSKFHYRTDKNPPLHSTLGHKNPVHTPKSNFLGSTLILSSHLSPSFPSGILPSVVRKENRRCPLVR